jgi:hypothetical protein
MLSLHPMIIRSRRVYALRRGLAQPPKLDSSITIRQGYLSEHPLTIDRWLHVAHAADLVAVVPYR